LYRPCTASFGVGSLKRLGDLAILRTKRKDDLEPYWQDEKDWLCTVEFVPTDDLEARLYGADIIGYLVGYAHLSNTRCLALLGDPDASAYELLFSFSSPEEKDQFLVQLTFSPSGQPALRHLAEELILARLPQRLLP
jgi:hypothetical protein